MPLINLINRELKAEQCRMLQASRQIVDYAQVDQEYVCCCMPAHMGTDVFSDTKILHVNQNCKSFLQTYSGLPSHNHVSIRKGFPCT